jgi:hypothetical protein
MTVTATLSLPVSPSLAHCGGSNESPQTRHQAASHGGTVPALAAAGYLTGGRHLLLPILRRAAAVTVTVPPPSGSGSGGANKSGPAITQGPSSRSGQNSARVGPAQHGAVLAGAKGALRFVEEDGRVRIRAEGGYLRPPSPGRRAGVAPEQRMSRGRAPGTASRRPSRFESVRPARAPSSPSPTRGLARVQRGGLAINGEAPGCSRRGALVRWK